MRVALAPLAAGAQRDATYRLPTGRRGRIQLGPLRAEVTDAFGLARRRVVLAGTATLTVLPNVEVLEGLPSGAGRDDPLAGPIRRTTGAGSDDFATLRPYVVGDDLRRVHWASTARAGDLLVRQDDERWQGHVTLVVDGRSDRIGPDGFEASVSAAASLVHAVGRAGDRVRLLGTDGTDSGSVDAHGAGDQLLERLAVAALHGGGDLPVIPTDGRSMTGSLVLLTGPVAPDTAALAAEASHHFATVVVVSAVAAPGAGSPGRSRPGAPATPSTAPAMADVEWTELAADQPFAPAWRELLTRRSSRR